MILIVHQWCAGHDCVAFLYVDFGLEPRKVVGSDGVDLCIGFVNSHVCHGSCNLEVKAFF